MTPRIAGSPVSYGVFELTWGVEPQVPEPDATLALLREAGYEGTELGPDGYFGDAARVPAAGLAVAGAYVGVGFGEAEDAAAVQAALDVFGATGASDAVLVLGDRLRAPDDRGDGDLLLRTLDAGAAAARGRGVRCGIHPHAGTLVERPEELERVLDACDIDLVLDTGHVTAGGGDPLETLRRWLDRTAHVHLKDVRRAAVERGPDGRLDVVEMWRRHAFCRLGEGDADVDAFVDELLRRGYDGWIVVEQDHLPDWAGGGLERAVADQKENRKWLEARLI
jgi:inosose dehydratase